MKGRGKTKAEKALHEKLREHGCAVCRYITKPEVDSLCLPQIHHIEGKTKPNAHCLVIPLCSIHHQHGTEASPSLHSVNGKHGGKAEFYEEYGVGEYDLLDMCEESIGYRYREGVK